MWHCGGAFAQSGDSTSTVAQKFRLSFDQELLNRLRAHDDFRYAEPPENRPNILKVIFQKVFEWLLVLVGNEFFAWLILTLIILVGVVGLGFGLYGIFGLGKTVPIYGTEPDQLKYGIKSENIHEISFVDEIETAVDERNFKKAIRLSYLLRSKCWPIRILSIGKFIKPTMTTHTKYRMSSIECRFRNLAIYSSMSGMAILRPAISITPPCAMHLMN